MRLRSKDGKMELPEYIKIGIELEVENVNGSGVKKALESLGIKKWNVTKDDSLADNGREIVSPPLSEYENENMWSEVEQVCKIISQNPYNHEKAAYTDHTCGGHIHFDASIFQTNPEVTRNFLRLWAECEELVYKMCNDRNDPIRESALYFSPVEALRNMLLAAPKAIAEVAQSGKIQDVPKACFKAAKGTWHGLIELVQSGMYRRGYSYSNGARILKAIQDNKLKVRTVQKAGKPKLKLNRALSKMTKHYSGLNLQNADNKRHSWEKIGKNKKINTVEFRMSNGTIDPRVLRENVFLYASLIQTAVRMTNEPELVHEKLKSFYETDISEEEKVKRFLNLIIDEPEDREVYQGRWESVKDEPVFQGKFAKGFAKDRFVRQDLRHVAENTRADQIRATLKVVMDKAKEMMLDERGGFTIPILGEG